MSAFGFGPEFDVKPEPTITVQKLSNYVTMSTEMALDYGIITEAQARERGWTPPPPPTRRQRFRYWRGHLWHKRPRVHFGPCDHRGCG
jgi:hypothetical protein